MKKNNFIYKKALFVAIKSSLLVVLSLFLLTGCDDMSISQKQPVTLTYWHVYGAQTRSPMNDLVEAFNQGPGKEHGIVVNVTSVSNSTAIHNPLVASAKKEPGSPELPDIFGCYPNTLQAMGSDIALNWEDHFTEEELAAFVPQFLQEGYIGSELKLFPVAKSTNAFFINAYTFDEFSKATGYTYEDLATWEGVFEVTEKYYTWSKGKAFFMYDDWIHYPMLNMQALGTSLFNGDSLAWNDPTYLKVMRPLARAAIKGEVCLMPGYSTKAIMIGEAIAGVESTASVLYFKDSVTHSDNTKTPLPLKILPEPRFANTKRVDLQRGTGLVALKSTPEKEKAAAIFCKWVVSKANNLPFVIQGGYMPVRIDDFARFSHTERKIPYPKESYNSLYTAIATLKNTSEFVVSPTFGAYGYLEQYFSQAVRVAFSQGRQSWLNSEDKSPAALELLVDTSLQTLQEKVLSLQKEHR